VGLGGAPQQQRDGGESSSQIKSSSSPFSYSSFHLLFHSLF
jgi:hypothetical protein